MIADLRTILEGWDYEPGKISVRKIIGCDGRDKIQTRVDLGVLQFEPLGRPDGRRPYGCDSMLTFFETRLQEYVDKHGTDEGFILLAEDCRDLRNEAHMYYQRYLSFFVLEEYDGVEQDTARNLRSIELCRRYAETEFDRSALEPQWAYVMMMHTRAKVYQALKAGHFQRAMRLLDEGVGEIEKWAFREESEDYESVTAELEVLESLRREALECMPADALPRLEWELGRALAQEDYERAAELRDKLTVLRRDEEAM